jgi:ketosteroid isomerase-like protein
VTKGFEINKRGIAQMAKEIEREFAKHPIRVPIEGDPSTSLAGQFGGSTTVYNGPVIFGDVDGAQLAWGNQTANQHQQQRTETITPGFEAIAQAVVSTLEQLPAAGLAEEDLREAEATADEVLTEVTRPEPDRGRIRRAVTALRGFLAPVATGLSVGAGEGAEEWARTAIEQLGVPF